MAYNNCNQPRVCNIYTQGPTGVPSTIEFLSLETINAEPIGNTFQNVVFETIVDQGGSDIQIFIPDSLIYLAVGHVYLVTYTVRVDNLGANPILFSARLAQNGSPLAYSLAEGSNSDLLTLTIEVANEVLIPTEIGSTLQLQVRNELATALNILNATISVVEII